MDKILIRESAKFGDCPAYGLAVEGAAALVRDGFHDGVGGFPCYWDDHVLFAIEEGATAPIGVLVYRKLEHENSFWIVLGYVAPTHRRSGVYRTLWDKLVWNAVDDKVRRIVGGAFIGNTASESMMAALRRRPYYTTYVYELAGDRTDEG